MYNQSKYDNEYVTKGELKEVEEEIPDKNEYNKNFGSTPSPPYYINDMWTDNGKVYKCVNERLFGSFNIDDWSLVATDDSYIEDFVENVYTAYELPIPEQVDNKIETFYQNEDPSLSWLTDIDKEIHKGDYWLIKDSGIQKRFIKKSINPISYEWARVSVPNVLFDMIDGHKNIYVNKPTEYEKNDYWIIDTLDDIPNDCEIGDIVISSISSYSYNKNDFEKKDLNTIAVTSIEDEYYNKEEVDIKTTELETATKAEIKKTKDDITLDVSSNIKPIIISKEQTNSYILLEDTPTSKGAINKLSIKGIPGQTNKYTILTSMYENFNVYDEIDINSPIVLTALEDNNEVISDEILIENNYIKIIQRIDYDELNNKFVLDSPITHDIGDVLLNTYDDNTYIKIKDFSVNINYCCEYIKKNLLTDLFTTNVETRAMMNISDQNIALKVSTNDIISAINLYPGIAKILAEKIQLEGLVTANQNFKILLDGSIVAVNASLTGNVFLPDGGKVIGGDGLFTNLQYLSDGYQSFNQIGWNTDMEGNSTKLSLNISAYIPDDFTVEKAYLTFYHMPIYYLSQLSDDYKWCYARNINLFKVSNFNNCYVIVDGFQASWEENAELTNTNKLSYTPTVSDTSHGITSVTTDDIGSFITNGLNEFKIQTSDSSPGDFGNSFCTKEWASTGYGFAILNVFGYMKT